MKAGTLRRLNRPIRARAKLTQQRSAGHPLQPEQQRVVLECGWGRVLFGHTFGSEPSALVEELRRERDNGRDLAFYIHEPHVVVAHAPQEVFLDPSHTYRLELADLRPAPQHQDGISIRRIQSDADIEAVNCLYSQHSMKTASPEFLLHNLHDRRRVVLVAQDASNRIIGTVTGIDHVETFDDPELGSSLWCLAVDSQYATPGTGEALIRNLAGRFLGRGRAWMDLSVMHDNEQAIALYEKLGFTRVAWFCLKRKNTFNRTLFVGPEAFASLNPYARIIVDEALARGIRVDLENPGAGYFRLSHAGRTIRCQESLTDLTSAVVMSRCADKAVCAARLRDAGLRTPQQQIAASPAANNDFLDRQGRLVVKPVSGEQGQGVSVDVRDPETLQAAILKASAHGKVLLETYVKGLDLRVLVINYQVVAAAIRQPATIIGDGRHNVATLIKKHSRRRAAATSGESTIPVDDETLRCIRDAGCELETIPPAGQSIQVRKTANLHTGGMLVDVTSTLHPTLADTAVRAAKALEIRVTGLDFIVDQADQPNYVLIEANERPGLANHAPQPTAQRFIDLLFPETA